MFNAFATKFGYNKLLLLFVLLYVSPLSQVELAQLQAQPRQRQQPPETVSSTDYLVEKRDFDLIFVNFTCSTNDGGHDNSDVDVTANPPASPSPTTSTNSPSTSVLQQPKRAKLVKKLSCHLSRNVRRRYLQMEMSFERQINQFDFDISIIMRRPHHATQQQFVLVNFTSMNGCDFLALKNQVVLMNLVRRTLERYSNIPRQCPFAPNTSYYVRNYRWDIEQMPAFYVEAPIRIEFAYIFENTTRLEGIIEAKLELKANKKFLPNL